MNDLIGTASLPWFLTHPDPKEIYLKGSHLVLDFENDNAGKGSALEESNDIVLACWTIYVDGQEVKRQHCWGGIYEQGELIQDIGKVDFIVAQNLKHELQWLKRCGLELRDVLGYDTLLAAWVLDGNRKLERNLEALAKRYNIPGKVDMISKFIKMGVLTRDIHPRWLQEYCYQDVDATHNVFLAQLKELEERNVFHLVHVRNMCCAVLADIEFQGLVLDPERVYEEYYKAVEIVERLGGQLAGITNGINLNSSKQLATFLYDVLQFEEATDYRGKPIRTGAGARGTGAEVLAKLVADTEEQAQFLKLYKEYNKQVSLLEKNLEFFKLICEQRDCKFFGNLQQGVVQTHRLSSSGRPILFKGKKKSKQVQFQNLPREFKRLFWSGDVDWVVRDDDGSQLEFRVAVEMGHDKTGLYEIENGVDIHTATADVLYKNGDPEISAIEDPKVRRQESKKNSFKPLYGGSWGSPAIVAYCEYFKEHYNGISETQRGWALKCVDKGMFTTPYGITFFFPGTKVRKNGTITNSTQIYNYPVQGFATGEIIPIALIYFWHRTRDLRVRIFNTVHDSIISYNHVDDVEATDKIVKQCFTYDVYEFLGRVYRLKFKVPLGLESKHGTHWGEGHGVKIDVWSDGREVVR